MTAKKGHGEFVEGVWVTAKSVQGRALYFETYIPEYGALFDKLPISAFCMEERYKRRYTFDRITIMGLF